MKVDPEPGPIRLGATVKDAITGFTGTVVGLVYYISGVEQAAVQPRVKKDGSMLDCQWLDTSCLQLMSNKSLTLPGAERRDPDGPGPAAPIR